MQLNRFHIFLCKIFRRYKFRQICKVLELKPYGWQKEYALTREPILRVSGGRRSGKTMAVMLRALMHDADPYGDADDYFNPDPDYFTHIKSRRLWYFDEYCRLYFRCVDAGIPIKPIFSKLNRRHYV